MSNHNYYQNKENLNINQTNQKYNLKDKDNSYYINNNNNNINDNNNNNRLFKKPTLFQVGLRHISPQKDPFDSIHLPHFNNNNYNNNKLCTK